MNNMQNDLTYYDYLFDEYTHDLNYFIKFIKENNITDIVTMYRGGLVLGTHLSNITNTRLSVINYQTYDKDPTETQTYPIFVINKLKPDSKILIVDDLVDSGRTMKEVTKNLDDSNLTYDVLTIFGDPKYSDWDFCREKPDKWIRFWWEL